MTYYINEECVLCGSCTGRCPQDAIRFDGEKYLIEQEKCIECGECVDACPNAAIKLEEKEELV